MKIVLLLGYSGVGKTTIARYFEKVSGWVHVELDRSSQAETHGSIAPLPSNGKLSKKYFDFLNDFLVENKIPGALISLPSTIIVDEKISRSLHSIGVKTIYLMAPPYFCFEQFLKRENEIGRGLNAYYWIRCNTRLCEFLNSPIVDGAMVFIDVVREKERLGLDEICTLIRSQIEAVPPVATDVFKN